MDEKPDTPAELKARALRHLVRREHSRAELARKLAPHAESKDAVEAVLDLLSTKNQQSDARFAEERARVLARKYGPAKIRQDLQARGIDAQLIEATRPADEIERARQIVKRKFQAETADRKELARRARFLQGRGFSYEAIRAALGEARED